MRLDTFITSVTTVLLRRQGVNLNTAPAQCYRIYDAALTVAEATGHVYSTLCPSNSTFMQAVTACLECSAAYAATATQVDEFPDLQSYYQWCLENTPEGSTAITTANSAEISSYYIANSAAIISNQSVIAASVGSVAGSSYSWCESYSVFYSTMATNCSLSDDATTFASSITRTTSTSTTPASIVPVPTASALTPGPTAGPTLVAAHSRSHTAAIGGGVGGGVGGLALILLIAWFIFRRRRRRNRKPSPAENQTAQEKAQLHSDDIKPDRKELEGIEPSRDMLEKKQTHISELPANEEVIDREKLKEMPSNEPTGHEMETTENEMAVLDRMARMADSTTLNSETARSEGPSAS